jgi:tetrapyrrole methylase family protein/MazG family protein
VEDPKLNENSFALFDLIKIVESLRGPNGCPWDRKQTPRSMLVYLIEELYELADAIETENPDDICEELGDVLFHIFFMARMFHEMGHFSIHDVAAGITEKMIRRHPHVFGTTTIDDADDIVQNWHKIKLSEKTNAAKDSILDSVPSKLPPLLRAYLLLERTARAGFDWNSVLENRGKSEKALSKLQLALSGAEQNMTDREVGDLLFMLVKFAQRVNIHPETALAGSLKRFEMRFKRFEKRILESGRDMEDIPDAEKREIWEQTA